MTKVLKRVMTVFMCVFLAASLFAEPASTGLNDSDVKNWAKNLNAIVKELKDLGAWSNDSINASAKQKAKVDGILNKYGISGSNCIEKFQMISQCSVIICGASELDAESAALLKAMGMDPLAELKKNVNAKDYAIVEANAKAVIKACEKLDDSDFGDDDDDFDSKNPYASAMEDMDDLEDLYSRLGNSFNQVTSQSSNLNMNEVNEEGKIVKNIYEQVSKAKGDSGLIYKTSKLASKYKKTAYKKGTKVKVEYGNDDEEKNQSSFEWTFDLDKKTAELEFEWKEAKADYKDYVNGYSVKETEKELKYTISSVEYYYLAEDPGRSYGEGIEYVISTKEGLVLHVWVEYDGDYNAYQSRIEIKGLSDLSKIDRDFFWRTE